MNMMQVNLRDQSQTPDCLSWSCCPEEVRGQRSEGEEDVESRSTSVHLLALLFVTLKTKAEACVVRSKVCSSQGPVVLTTSTLCTA